MKNLKHYCGSIIGLALALSFFAWCLASPYSASGQAGKRGSGEVENAAPAPGIQDLIAQQGTGLALACSTPITFETGAQGFTVQPVAGPALWHVTSNMCGAQLPGHSLTSTFYYGRDSDCTYLEGTRTASNLISPQIFIPTDLRPVAISFNYLLAVEGGFFDQVNVDVSANNGASWTPLLSKVNLINDGAWHNASAFVPDGVVGTSSFIRLRFRLDTIDSLFNSTIGWHIDDVQVCSQEVSFCVQDDFNGNILLFNQETGDYVFKDCRKGARLSGTGTVTKTSCKVELVDSGPTPKTPDRNVSILVNPCTSKGSGTVSIKSTGQTYTLSDSNLLNNVCACP